MPGKDQSFFSSQTGVRRPPCKRWSRGRFFRVLIVIWFNFALGIYCAVVAISRSTIQLSFL
jgi:hypothetical protein